MRRKIAAEWEVSGEGMSTFRHASIILSRDRKIFTHKLIMTISAALCVAKNSNNKAGQHRCLHFNDLGTL